MTQLFLKIFSMVFLAEMGDKTQLAAFTAAAGSPDKKWVVFAASALALATTSLLAVLCGGWIGGHVSPKWIKIVAGSVFIVFGILYIVEAFRGA